MTFMVFHTVGGGRKSCGDLDGGATEAGIEMVEALHEGAGLGVDEFGGFLEQAQLGLAGMRAGERN